jgi:signal transduction histidine kinase
MSSKKDTAEAKKKRLPLTHSPVLKLFAMLVLVVVTFVAVFSIGVVVAAYRSDFYTMNADLLRREQFEDICYAKCYDLIGYFELGEERLAAALERSNIEYVKIENTEGVALEYKTGTKYRTPYVFTVVTSPAVLDESGNIITEAETTILSIGVARKMQAFDEFMLYDVLIWAIYLLMDWIPLIIIGILIVAVVCFAFLMAAAGKRRKREGVRAGVLTKIPFDLVTAGVLLAISFGLYLLTEMIGSVITLGELLAALPVMALIFIVSILWCMSLALRIKLGTVFTNTLVYKLVWLIGKGIQSVPLVPKTVVILLVISAVEAFFIFANNGSAERLAFWWVIEKLLIIGACIYIALSLRKVKLAAKEIASGKLAHKVKISRLLPDIREHAETLSGIGEGMNLALEERIRSERMKTELITNVSHDIRTPLTSIINYSDLICREEKGSEKIHEYAEVLHRQSIRMKRLIDDLIEAAKASSGNVELDMIECDAGVFIAQSLAEFEDRLRSAELEVVLTRPEGEAKILADGRSLYRVFDNLLGNICKYSQKATRVYISLEKRDGRIIYTFKNISKDPLNISPEELGERFVRGDSSRNTEGNGLGLSISKSLVELQGGEMVISVDGDLFKVTLSFDDKEKTTAL